MKTAIAKRLICWLDGHDWRNDLKFPTHGYNDTPFPNSYCDRCDLPGWKYLGMKAMPERNG